MKNPDLLLQKFLPYRLSRLLNAVSEGLSRTYSPQFGLNVSQWRMLSAAAQLQPTSVTELTDYSGMDKVTVSRSVRDLVERDLLSRESHGSDKRRSILTLTAEGERVYNTIAPAALQFEKALVEGLPQEALDNFHETIDLLLNRIAVMQRGSEGLMPHDVVERAIRHRGRPRPAG